MTDLHVSDAIRYIGADDTTIDLFESQYPVPNGVSYNSYVILDEKVAVMDTVDRRAAEECLALRASFCYLAHNHVSGIALPSPEDVNTTDVVRAALAPLGVRLVDHLVFVDGDMVSIRQSQQVGWGRGFRMIYPGQM